MNKRILMTLALTAAAGILVAGGGAGCAQSKEVGKSGKQLLRGEVGGVVEQSPAEVGQAVGAAIADLNLVRIGASTRPSKEQVETVVIARNAKDAKVTIAYRATDQSEKSTRIAVSTGMMGSSELRDQVWDAVRIRLGILNASAGSGATRGATTTAPAPRPTTAPAE